MSDRQRAEPKVRCADCRHFFITHEPGWPYGCRAMGFKSRELPCAAVLRSSGEACLAHEPKGGAAGGGKAGR